MARTTARRRSRWLLGLGLLLLATVVIAPTLLVGWLWLGSGAHTDDGQLRVYPARRILTMDPSAPEAEAVAIAAGRIVAIGSRAEVERALEGRPFVVDERLAEQVVLPGFIDPHVHPVLSVMFNLEIVSAMEWQKPEGPTVPVRGRDAFLARIAELASEGEPDEWLLTWGYHEPYHGRIDRDALDQAAGGRPLLVWQRSAHEMYFNTAGLEAAGFSQAEFDAQPGADWERGRLYESGLLALGDRILSIVFTPTRFTESLDMMSDTLHRGGLTTVGEQGFPQRSVLGELLLLHLELRGDDVRQRWVLVPNAMYLMREHGDAGRAERAAARMLRLSTERARLVKHVKYYADGAIFAQLMQMTEPYLDGHHGEWMTSPEEQRAVLDAFWQAGWTVHVHVNGDAGLDLVLDQLEAVRAAHPEVDGGSEVDGGRLILEHYGYARPDQHARVRALGAEVSNNAYYTHELAPIYADHGLGPERAADISPLGGLARAGVPFSVHSDFPMAPAEPLRLAWVAVNRIGSDGRVWGEDERVPVELALRAITIEGARSLGMEAEVGSLEVGKRADLTILERDPYATPSEEIADIPIWGTMLDGRLHPLE